MKHQFFLVSLMLLLLQMGSSPAQTASVSDDGATAEDVVRILYEYVTFGPGTTPDWDAVKELFLPQATIILRTTREATSVFTVDEFVQDFVSFIEGSNVKETGFSEKILKLHPVVFGDMASIMVLYEASIPGRDVPAQQGVDMFLLSKREGGWKIVAITNDIPALGFALPQVLQ